ncbi:MAG: VCBS repeat-containing protein [Saprospiraceae bacterium]|nr:VCBS repeat-containing protein [Saprospiraceae bacterium]
MFQRNIKYIHLVFITLILTMNACKEGNDGQSTETSFTERTGKETGINFVNNVKDRPDINVLNYRNFYNGGGVAIGDINNDGLDDVYFASNLEANKLYLNKGQLKFEDITDKAGIAGQGFWSTGVSMVDINADGFLDIYVCYSGEIAGGKRTNELYINNGDLTFSEKASEYGLADDGFTTHASFFDYDRDGDLDCFILNNSYTDPQRIQVVSRDRFNYGAPGGDRLYRNEGGKFVDVTKESGIFSGEIDFGLGVSTGDVNNDGYLDIYVSNDFWERDYLYINQKDGTFKEELTDRFGYISANSMGADIADINNDGFLDIFSTDMLPASNKRLKSAINLEEYFLEDMKMKSTYFFQFVQNGLQLNNGDGTFKEIARYAGVDATDWSWGSLIADFNNDGNKDIFVSNGIYHDITDLDFIDFLADESFVKNVVKESGKTDFTPFAEKLPLNKQVNYLFINDGNLKFKNKAVEMGIKTPSFSNGSAYGDLDNDGDLDLVVNNVNSEAMIYENNTKSNYLKIKLKGQGNNTGAIGTRLQLYTSKGIQILEQLPFRGFQSSCSYDLIFGLEAGVEIDSMKIDWYDGKSTMLEKKSLKMNETNSITYKDVPFTDSKVTITPNHIFKEISAEVFEAPFMHVENLYNDFDHERLMPHMLSNMGPKILKGDLNEDHEDDIILLGAKGQKTSVYIQKNGKFELKDQPAFELDKISDKVAGALFDIDQDNDLDLIIALGGNEYQGGEISFTSRFYLNDGKGNFVPDMLGPYVAGNIGCVVPCDFDNDHDYDLFIGAKSIPGVYGSTPRSWLMRNDGESWTDLTDETIGTLGMVSDATWVDLNGDKWKDLVVVGEWMPITYLLNENGKKLGTKKSLTNSEGWWNVIKQDDLDGDGDIDFVVGNWGENFRFKATVERPLKLYVNDFDKNGKIESILEWYGPEDTKPYPFASKKDLMAQLPYLKKKNLLYSEYANKQVADLIDKDLLDKSEQHICKTFSSGIIWNDNKVLNFVPLPVEAQLSAVFAIDISDYDGDGLKDIFLGGNFYRLKPEVGRIDGFNGGYFKGGKDKQFTFVNAVESGLKIQGEVRDVQFFDGKLFVARNNNSTLVFEPTSFIK